MKKLRVVQDSEELIIVFDNWECACMYSVTKHSYDAKFAAKQRHQSAIGLSIYDLNFSRILFKEKQYNLQVLLLSSH